MTSTCNRRPSCSEQSVAFFQRISVSLTYVIEALLLPCSLCEFHKCKLFSVLLIDTGRGPSQLRLIKKSLSPRIKRNHETLLTFSTTNHIYEPTQSLCHAHAAAAAELRGAKRFLQRTAVAALRSNIQLCIRRVNRMQQSMQSALFSTS